MDLSHLLNTTIGLLLSGGLWMLRNIQARLTKQDTTLAEIAKDVTIVQTVLMGAPPGTNGLRSDVRAAEAAIAALGSRLDRAGADQ